MKTKQLIFLVTMTLSVIGFNGNSFGFDLGGALNSITKELEKVIKINDKYTMRISSNLLQVPCE